MDSSKSMLIALRFNERINEGDSEGLAELMTDDHTFVDNEGNITKGKDAMKESWKDFFKTYPDYRNNLTCITVQNDIVVLVGFSTCTHRQLNGPNIWTAKITAGKVSEWRVHWLNQR